MTWLLIAHSLNSFIKKKNQYITTLDHWTPFRMNLVYSFSLTDWCTFIQKGLTWWSHQMIAVISNNYDQANIIMTVKVSLSLLFPYPINVQLHLAPAGVAVSQIETCDSLLQKSIITQTISYTESLLVQFGNACT